MAALSSRGRVIAHEYTSSIEYRQQLGSRAQPREYHGSNGYPEKP